MTTDENQLIVEQNTSADTMEGAVQEPIINTESINDTLRPAIDMALPNAEFIEHAVPLDLKATKISPQKFRIEPVKFSDLLHEMPPGFYINLGKGFDIKLGSPVYITTVHIVLKTSNPRRMEFTFKSPIQARKLEVDPVTASNTAIYEINGFATSFSVVPSSIWLASDTVQIESIHFFGYEPEKFAQIETTVRAYTHGLQMRQESLDAFERNLNHREQIFTQEAQLHSSRVTEFESNLETRETKIKDLELTSNNSLIQISEKLSELNRQVEIITIEKNSLEKSSVEIKTEVSSLESKATELKQKVDALDETVGDRQNEIDSKSAAILKMTDQLKKLENDLSVTVDLKGYGKKTLFNIALYALGILILLVMGYELTKYALAESKEIWTAYIDKPTLLDIKVLVGIKLPFILLVGTALTTLFKLALALLRRIIQNDDRRTSLTEISILAGDLTDAATYGSEVTESDRTKLKFAAKMWLVRDLLSNRILNSDDNLKEVSEPSAAILEWVKNLPQWTKKEK